MKNIRLLLSSIMISLIFISLTAQEIDLKQPVPPDPAIKIGKLDNGITYYIKQNKKPEQRMELRLAVNAGSVCETDGQQGLAHFVEHMCFKGTELRNQKQISGAIDNVGGILNAESQS